MDIIIDNVRKSISYGNLKRAGMYSKNKDGNTEHTEHTEHTATLVEINSSDQMSSFLDTMNQAFERRDWWKLDKFIQKKKIEDYISLLADDDSKQTILKLFEEGKMKRNHIQYNKSKAIIEHIII